jgi:carbonic anhydrase
MPFSDVEENLKGGCEDDPREPVPPKGEVEVTGWVYDVKTEQLREVAVT